MLRTSKPIAFAATIDRAKARAFYEGALGLHFVSEHEFAVVYDAQGVELRVQKVKAFTPNRILFSAGLSPQSIRRSEC